MKLQSPQDNYLRGQIPPLPFRAEKKIFTTFVGAAIILLITLLFSYFATPKVTWEFTSIETLVFKLTIFFGGICLLSYYLYSTRGKYVFELLPEGVIYKANSPVLSWREINEAKTVSLMNRPFVGIFLKNNDTYIFPLSPYQQELARTSINLTGTPIVIAPQNAKISNDDLIAWINHYKNLYGTQS